MGWMDRNNDWDVVGLADVAGRMDEYGNLRPRSSVSGTDSDSSAPSVVSPSPKPRTLYRNHDSGSHYTATHKSPPPPVSYYSNDSGSDFTARSVQTSPQLRIRKPRVTNERYRRRVAAREEAASSLDEEQTPRSSRYRRKPILKENVALSVEEQAPQATLDQSRRKPLLNERVTLSVEEQTPRATLDRFRRKPLSLKEKVALNVEEQTPRGALDRLRRRAILKEEVALSIEEEIPRVSHDRYRTEAAAKEEVALSIEGETPLVWRDRYRKEALPKEDVASILAEQEALYAEHGTTSPTTPHVTRFDTLTYDTYITSRNIAGRLRLARGTGPLHDPNEPEWKRRLHPGSVTYQRKLREEQKENGRQAWDAMRLLARRLSGSRSSTPSAQEVQIPISPPAQEVQRPVSSPAEEMQRPVSPILSDLVNDSPKEDPATSDFAAEHSELVDDSQKEDQRKFESAPKLSREVNNTRMNNMSSASLEMDLPKSESVPNRLQDVNETPRVIGAFLETPAPPIYSEKVREPTIRDTPMVTGAYIETPAPIRSVANTSTTEPRQLALINTAKHVSVADDLRKIQGKPEVEDATLDRFEASELAEIAIAKHSTIHQRPVGSFLYNEHGQPLSQNEMDQRMELYLAANFGRMMMESMALYLPNLDATAASIREAREGIERLEERISGSSHAETPRSPTLLQIIPRWFWIVLAIFWIWYFLEGVADLAFNHSYHPYALPVWISGQLGYDRMDVFIYLNGGGSSGYYRQRYRHG